MLAWVLSVSGIASYWFCHDWSFNNTQLPLDVSPRESVSPPFSLRKIPLSSFKTSSRNCHISFLKSSSWKVFVYGFTYSLILATRLAPKPKFLTQTEAVGVSTFGIFWSPAVSFEFIDWILNCSDLDEEEDGVMSFSVEGGWWWPKGFLISFP